MTRRWPAVVSTLFVVLLIVAVSYLAGPRLPGWIEASNRLERQILQVEADCRNPSRDVVQWEICDSAGRKIVWINYPGEQSAYDAVEGELVYYWTGHRCVADGPWYLPWKGESCGKSHREHGIRPGCGTFPVCDPDAWAEPCTGAQISRLGCANFNLLSGALRSRRPTSP